MNLRVRDDISEARHSSRTEKHQEKQHTINIGNELSFQGWEGYISEIVIMKQDQTRLRKRQKLHWLQLDARDIYSINICFRKTFHFTHKHTHGIAKSSGECETRVQGLNRRHFNTFRIFELLNKFHSRLEQEKELLQFLVVLQLPCLLRLDNNHLEFITFLRETLVPDINNVRLRVHKALR